MQLRMFKTAFLPFLGLLLVVRNHGAVADAHQEINAGTCGLQDIPEDTSPDNLYMLPPFSDNLQNGIRAWEHPTFGAVTRVTVSTDPVAHTSYLTASFSVLSSMYWIAGNTRTSKFVQEQGVRLMKRYVTFHCADGTTAPRYHFGITFQDMEPPQFAEEEYIFNITKDWNSNERPISDQQSILVSDNALELENDKEILQFEASDDIIDVVAYPLWVLPYPAKYYFRLDIYLKENVELAAGQTFQTFLYARDEHNVGVTKITINVVEDSPV